MMTATPEKFVQVTIEIDAETGVAIAVIAESSTAFEFSTQKLDALLAEQQIADWFKSESAISELTQKFNKGSPGKFSIAQRKDADYSLVIADDKMSATVEFTPAYGGKSLDETALLEALYKKNIDKKRINTAAVKALTQASAPANVIVAQGKPPISGRDSVFVQLLDNPDKDAPLEEDENGMVDFLAGKEYLTVAVGTPLMERIPPLPGKIGMDIFGQIIPAGSGKEVPFSSQLEGTEFASDNTNILIAKTAGHPVYYADGVHVDETLTFDNINISTGHVNFDGSIHVKGDIQADMKVEVTGDIFVKGVVEKAELIAGNDITIAGGVLGDTQTEIDEDDDSLPEYMCHLTAGGYIQARYINLAQLTAKQDIQIREYAFNSLLKAGNNILLGQDGGRGNLVGGLAIAGHAIIAKTLGNKAYNKTETRVGISTEELKKTRKLKFIREQRVEQARNLKKLLDEIKQHNKQEKIGQVELDKANKIHDSLLHIQQDLKVIDARIHNFDFAVFTNDEPNISSSSACYPNCSITINGTLLHTKQEHKAITFIKRGRRITAKS